MNLLEIRYDVGKEEVVQLVSELCGETFKRIPLFEICEDIIFIHSET